MNMSPGNENSTNKYNNKPIDQTALAYAPTYTHTYRDGLAVQHGRLAEGLYSVPDSVPKVQQPAETPFLLIQSDDLCLFKAEM